MTVKLLPNDQKSIAGKLADAELHFTEGPLAGLRLLGFAVWVQRVGSERHVTCPARTYSVAGERRSFALLRPIEGTEALQSVKQAILDAYAQFEKERAQ